MMLDRSNGVVRQGVNDVGHDVPPPLGGVCMCEKSRTVGPGGQEA
jgi:hypothetical protein